MTVDERVAGALARVAASGLDTTHRDVTTPLDAGKWAGFCRAVQEHRLSGLVVHAIAMGDLAVTDDQLEATADLDLAWQKHVLQIERLLEEVLDALDSAGVTHLLFKGSALAHTVYDDPAERVFGDLDILVPGAQLDAAQGALRERLDGVEAFPEIRRGFDAEFAKDVLIRARGHELDLHRSLAAGPFGLRIPVAELFDSTATFALGERVVRTLDPVPTFVQVCYNAALGDVPPRLLSLRDVAQVYSRSSASVDDIVATAERWGGAAVVAHAVVTAWRTLGLAPDDLSRWAGGYRPGPLDRRLLAASTSERRSYARQVASLAAIPGTRAKGRYLRAILSPSPEYLAARGWTRGSHVRRAVDRLRPRR